MRKLLTIELFLCAVVLAVFATWRMHRTPRPLAPQQIVDAFVALQPSFDLAQLPLLASGSLTNKSDVNRYFTVLDALHPVEGYTLDWVYLLNNGMGGDPILYIRRTNEPAYKTFEDFASISFDVLSASASNGPFDNSFGLRYLDGIQVEDSAKGYFQFVVLTLLGDRFLLYWHSLYGERFLVCSRQGWESLLRQQQRDDSYTAPPPDFVAAAKRLDFSPRIQLSPSSAVVAVTTFQPFGGLDRHQFTISRSYPHRILSHTQSNLLSHTQSFLF